MGPSSHRHVRRRTVVGSALVAATAGVVGFARLESDGTPLRHPAAGGRLLLSSSSSDVATVEVALGDVLDSNAGAALARGAVARPLVAHGGVTRSPKLPTTGFAMVGFTWRGHDQTNLKIRTRATGGSWSPWSAMTHLHDRPDPGSGEGIPGHSGTEVRWVGRNDEIQVEVHGHRPHELTLVLIDPKSRASDAIAVPRRRTPAAALAGGAAAFAKPAAHTSATPTPTHSASPTASPTSHPTATVSSTPTSSPTVKPTVTPTGTPTKPPKPTMAPNPALLSREDWGADESWRNGAPRYNRTIQQAHIHHTDSVNDYDAADVPALLRGMYYYHTHSLGWSDIAYNFLVDRFGRCWVGRAGGPGKAVRGAHTLGFNATSVGISIIGNFDTVEPDQAILTSIVHLAAWKLDLYGRTPTGTAIVYSEGSDKFPEGRIVTLPVIDGHRDTNDTACPGNHLYVKLPHIRTRTQARVNRFNPPKTKPTTKPSSHA